LFFSSLHFNSYSLLFALSYFYAAMLQVFFLIAILLFVVYAALIIYYAAAWRQLPLYNAAGKNFKTTITVIIAARNEAANIGNCLGSLQNQSYPKHLYKVLVVDDFSEDATANIVNQFSNSNIQLLLLKDFIRADETQSYKKKAIEVAIQQATGELMVTTDADCLMPVNWLQTIAAFYQEQQPEFIAMPVLIAPVKSFIQLFQSLDFMTLQGITGASVFKKFHSMCNGANLAYTKKAFNAVNGFAGIDNIASGDDMLLMHKIYKQYPGKVLFLKSNNVIVHTQPVNTVGAFFNQRIRWASKADKYDDKRIFFVLLLVYLFNVVLLLFPFIAALNNQQFKTFNFQFSTFNIWLSLLILKTLIELYFLYPVAKFFNRVNLLWWFPVMQPFHILYTVIAGWLGKFGSYKWKGRNVK
jgi:cellulose synthase/poly-beta-1,6-N-acetylglucosamine synthase-like glycosyltransferase